MDERGMQKRLRKITLFFTLVSLVLLMGSGGISIMLNHTFQNEIEDQIVTETNRHRTNINRKIDTDLQTLYTLSSFIEFSGTIDSSQFAKGLYESNNENSFLQMGYFEKGGTGIRVTVNGAMEENVKAEETDSTFYESIQKAWDGKNVVSDVYHDSAADEDFIAYAVPVQKNGTVVGALTACESTSVFFDVLSIKSGFSEQTKVRVMGTDGKFFLPAQSGDQADSVSDILLSEKERTAFQNMLEQGKSKFMEVNENGQTCRMFAEPVGVHDWYLVLTATERGISEPLYQNLLITRIIFFLLLALSGMCILYGARLMKRNSRALLRFAYYDQLTGSYNMVKFSHMLEETIASTRDFSLVAMNIRKFKFINETFGDEVANQLLCYVKKVLDEAVFEGEFFCRETADKFYILMRTSDENLVKRRLEEITEHIRDFFLHHNRQYRMMIYAGVVTGAEINGSFVKREELMSHVMFALDRAKKRQQDEIWFYNTETYKKEQLQNYMESHMNQALQDEEFRLFLQPKINLRKGTLGGAEALVRWITAEGRMIFPDQFIPLFEQNGFCTELDLYMVELACRQIRQWMDEGKEAIPISVNQSKLLFYKDGYVENLCEIMERYHVPAKMITLEILEGLALGDAEGLNSRIRELKEKGFQISMDDFGSGYSSLNILCSLEIDELKLDRAFLMEMPGHKKWQQQIVMEQIAQLAKKMNMTTVAEGVETWEDEAFILKAGCDYGQGYYYSKPLCAAEFTEKYM